MNFEHSRPIHDSRAESCHVYEDRISIDGAIKQSERSEFINRFVDKSIEDAAELGRSLAIIRPQNPRFIIKKKPQSLIAAEEQAYERAASQFSFLDKELTALKPCPYIFAYRFEDAGRTRTFPNGDWEAYATYWRLEKTLGTQSAL